MPPALADQPDKTIEAAFAAAPTLRGVLARLDLGLGPGLGLGLGSDLDPNPDPDLDLDARLPPERERRLARAYVRAFCAEGLPRLAEAAGARALLAAAAAATATATGSGAGGGAGDGDGDGMAVSGPIATGGVAKRAVMTSDRVVVVSNNVAAAEQLLRRFGLREMVSEVLGDAHVYAGEPGRFAGVWEGVRRAAGLVGVAAKTGEGEEGVQEEGQKAADAVVVSRAKYDLGIAKVIGARAVWVREIEVGGGEGEVHEADSGIEVVKDLEELRVKLFGEDARTADAGSADVMEVDAGADQDEWTI